MTTAPTNGMQSADGIYVYCIIESDAAHSFGPIGIGGREAAIGEAEIIVAAKADDAPTRERARRAGLEGAAVKELQEILALETPPFRIEAYDISNFQSGESVGSMVVSGAVGPRRPNPTKLSAYECGNEPLAEIRGVRFSVKFYLVAMIFLLFDIELAFVYPWALALRDLGWTGFLQLALFILLLFFGYLYVWRKGALDWGHERGDGSRI